MGLEKQNTDVEAALGWRRVDPVLPQQPVITVDVWVCVLLRAFVFEGGAPPQTGGEWLVWLVSEWDVRFGAHACRSLFTPTNTCCFEAPLVLLVLWKIRVRVSELLASGFGLQGLKNSEFVVCQRLSCFGTARGPRRSHPRGEYLVCEVNWPSSAPLLNNLSELIVY